MRIHGPVFAFCLLLPATALANDTAVGGSGSDLVPLSSTQVRMKVEDILIRAVGKDWEVEAKYTFENLAKRAVKLQVGFPEYACEGGDPSDETMCDPAPLRFESMRTSVDGQPVEHRRGTIKKGHPWLPRLGQVWLYDVSFEPGRETKIEHRYRVAQGEVSDGTALGSYVTRTGATWAGTIGHARFRIHVPVETRRLSVEPQEKHGRGSAEALAAAGLSFTTHVVEVGSVKTGEMLLEAHDWEPKIDLAFEFYAKGVQGHAAYEMVQFEDSHPITERCPNLSALWIVGKMRAEPNPGDHIPPSDPTDEDVERFVREGLGSGRICSGYIYATYGKRFEDDALNRRFYGWEGWKPKGWPYGEMQPNPGYSDAMLTPADRATLQLIERVEARLSCKASVGKGSPGGATSATTGSAASTTAPARAPAAAARGCGCRALGGVSSSSTRSTLAWFLALAVGLAARRRRDRCSVLARQPASRGLGGCVRDVRLARAAVATSLASIPYAAQGSLRAVVPLRELLARQWHARMPSHSPPPPRDASGRACGPEEQAARPFCASATGDITSRASTTARDQARWQTFSCGRSKLGHRWVVLPGTRAAPRRRLASKDRGGRLGPLPLG